MMDIYKGQHYLVVNRRVGNTFDLGICEGHEIYKLITKDTVEIGMIHTYEVYTCNPETGEGGWDIHYIRSTDRLIKYYPDFDCIITKNDTGSNEVEEFVHAGWKAYYNR
jgi:hypothetical protein